MPETPWTDEDENNKKYVLDRMPNAVSNETIEGWTIMNGAKALSPRFDTEATAWLIVSCTI